jgi:replicative DNA helicase
MEENLKLPSKLLEPLILAGCLRNASLFLKVKSYLFTSSRSKNYFSDEKYQNVFNLMCRWFDKFKSMPSKDELKILIDKTKEDSEVKFLLNSIVDAMFDKKDEINYDYLEEELVSFIKENRVYEAMASAQFDIDKGNYGAIVNKMEDAVRVSFDKDLGNSIKDVGSAMEKVNRLNNESCISSGFPNLDSVLEGGFHSKEIYNFSGIPGAGKTLILGNLALNAFLQGKNVLVYTFETSFERLFIRYISNLSGMSKKEIFLDEEGAKEKLSRTFSNTTGDLIIKEYNSNAVCSNDIIAHINDLWMYKKWKPDVVIIDYLLIMLTNDKTLSAENSYKYYKTVTEEVRNIGKSLDRKSVV